MIKITDYYTGFVVKPPLGGWGVDVGVPQRTFVTGQIVAREYSCKKVSQCLIVSINVKKHF
jgi:hypothetical protein